MAPSELKRLEGYLLNTNDIDAIKQKYAVELVRLSFTTRNTMQSTITAMEKSIDDISLLAHSTKTLQADMRSVIAYCRDCAALDQNFGLIEQIFGTRRRFVAVQQMSAMLAQTQASIARLNALFDEDLRQDFLNADNLLLVAYYIATIEEFQLKLHYEAESGVSTAFLDDYFATFNGIKAKFWNEYFFELSKFIFDFILEEKPVLVQWILRVVEAEERRECETIRIKEAIASKKEALILAHAAEAHRANKELRNPRRTFLNTLKAIIRERFEAAASTAADPDDMEAVMGTMQFVSADLMLAKSIFCMLFPPSYNIFEFCLHEYHSLVYQTVSRYTSKQLGPNEILVVMRWCKEYHDDLADRVQVFREQLDPPLMEAKEGAYIDEFVRRSQTKTDEWMGNLLRQTAQIFAARQEEPEKDADGRYISPVAVDLFQIVKQTLDSAAKASRDKLLARTVNHVTQSTEKFQKGITEMIRAEVKKFIDNPEKAIGGLDHYLVMMANTCLKWIEFNDDFCNKFVQYVTEDHKDEVSTAFRRINDGFVGIAKTVNNSIVEMVMRNLQSLTSTYFTAKWYAGDHVETIVATIDDYNQDAFVHAEDFVRMRIMSDLIDRCITCYLEAMRAKNASFDTSKCVSRMKADLEAFLAYFSEQKAKQRVEKSFDPIKRMIQLMSSPPDHIFVDMCNILQDYPDFPMWFLEVILKKRSDVSSAEAKKVMEVVVAKAKQVKTPDSPISVFSKIIK